VDWGVANPSQREILAKFKVSDWLSFGIKKGDLVSLGIVEGTAGNDSAHFIGGKDMQEA
jgi:hypothetical protein